MKGRLIPVVVVAALAGCSKVHEQRSLTLEPGAVNHLEVSAPVSEQKVKVVMTADNPVSVFVMLVKDVPQGMTEVGPGTLPQGILAGEKNTKEATLSVTIPAKEKFRVYIGGVTKATNVSLKIDSE
jgi:hypothetical protein